jgi:hypothetical protein
MKKFQTQNEYIVLSLIVANDQIYISLFKIGTNGGQGMKEKNPSLFSQ